MSRVYRYVHIGLITALLLTAVAFEASAVPTEARHAQPEVLAYATAGAR